MKRNLLRFICFALCIVMMTNMPAAELFPTESYLDISFSNGFASSIAENTY